MSRQQRKRRIRLNKTIGKNHQNKIKWDENKDNQVIRNRGDTKYSQTENSQNQTAQECAWVQVSTAGGGAGGWSS